MEWTKSAEGFDEIVAGEGMHVRLLPPDPAAKRPAPYWRIEKLQDDGTWKKQSGYPRTEAEARVRAEALIRHPGELAALAREQVSFGPGTAATRTPWGAAQHGEIYEKGVAFYSTAGHGGFDLDRSHHGKVHEAWRAKGGWYEEDSDWAIVAITFPHLFTSLEMIMARETAKDWNPYGYMAATGETVTPEESLKLRTDLHAEKHRNDWLVISAVTSDDDRSMVKCTATVGGRRDFSEAKEFLVPAEEYGTRGGLSFPIDLARHEEIAPVSGPAP